MPHQFNKLDILSVSHLLLLKRETLMYNIIIWFWHSTLINVLHHTKLNSIKQKWEVFDKMAHTS